MSVFGGESMYVKKIDEESTMFSGTSREYYLRHEMWSIDAVWISSLSGQLVCLLNV